MLVLCLLEQHVYIYVGSMSIETTCIYIYVGSMSIGTTCIYIYVGSMSIGTPCVGMLVLCLLEHRVCRCFGPFCVGTTST